MNPAAIIARKRDGFELSPEELTFFIRNYVNDSIADYQMSALLMAIYLNGMTFAEPGC
jgi:pyrimidine-nucleoside phosphorylase